MHSWNKLRRTAAVALSTVVAAGVLGTPLTSSAQTAPRQGWGYGYNVTLWHYDTVARSNVIGDVTQAGRYD